MQTADAGRSFRGEATISFRTPARHVRRNNERAFSLFSTKAKGTGLGLIVERVIDSSGRISVESTQGRGTTVLISMPMHAEQPVMAGQ
jgi:signal transduction histidine kinase